MEESTPQGEARCAVKCSCGSIRTVRCNQLRSGKTTMCKACAAIQRHQRDRDNGIVWRDSLLNPMSNQARIKAFEKRLQQDAEQYALEDYYRYSR